MTISHPWFGRQRFAGARFFLFAIAFCTSAVQAQESAQNAMFPFVMPWDDASKTITDVSALNPAPLDQTRRVSVRDGHFTDLTGRRVRFLGTNLTFYANFPDKGDSEKMAARMHKYGFNLVRLHHMDTSFAPRGIFDAKFPDRSRLDADQMDRLDYLLAQFKKNGIYVDLNLHVGRGLSEADGVPDTDKISKYGKGLTYFEPHLLEIQKNYARALVTHLNPYTNLRYADDPVVALIEIVNEDTLVGQAWEGDLPKLPAYYQAPLLARWNAFLKTKYGTTAQLLASVNQPLGAQLLSNGDFAAQTDNWRLETGGAKAKIASETLPSDAATLVGNARALRVAVSAAGPEKSNVQLHQIGLTLAAGQGYNVRFWARSDAPRTVKVQARLNQAPWNLVGLTRTLEFTPQWQHFNLNFTADNSVDGANRLTFALGNTNGDIWLANVKLRAGQEVELPAAQSIEAATMPMPSGPFAPLGADFTAFLMNVERDFVTEMARYLKNDLGAKALVSGSQATYGGLAGAARESDMDYVDAHAYWQHPKFPGKPWDGTNWTILNTSMVRAENGGTLGRLSMNRIEGKPFTVSEYNHPAPNEFGAETLPMLASYAAWQDWDGVMLFDYATDRDALHDDAFKNYFDISHNPAKMAFMPAAAQIFLRGDVAASAQQTVLEVPREQLPLLVSRFNNIAGVWEGGLGFRGTSNAWEAAGQTPQDLKNQAVALRFVDGGEMRLDKTGNADASSLSWNPAPAQNATFTVNSAKSKVLVGFPDATVELGDLSVTLLPTARKFLSLTLGAKDDKPLNQSRSLLLTVAGNVENTGMIWNAERTSVSDNWGHGPTIAEGIPAQMTLRTAARGAEIYALNGSGARLGKVPSQLRNGQLSWSVGPQYRTLWYEIALQP